MDMDNQIVVYKASDGNELAVKTDGETVSTRVADLCLCRTICHRGLKRMCLTDSRRLQVAGMANEERIRVCASPAATSPGRCGKPFLICHEPEVVPSRRAERSNLKICIAFAIGGEI